MNNVLYIDFHCQRIPLINIDVNRDLISQIIYKTYKENIPLIGFHQEFLGEIPEDIIMVEPMFMSDEKIHVEDVFKVIKKYPIYFKHKDSTDICSLNFKSFIKYFNPEAVICFGDCSYTLTEEIINVLVAFTPKIYYIEDVNFGYGIDHRLTNIPSSILTTSNILYR